MRAALYARYSSSLQRPTSIADQLAVCRQVAEQLGYEVLEIFTDEETSGAVTARAGYQALIAAAKERRFQAVIVEGQDRLWRDQAEMHSALRRLRFWEIRVYTADTGTDLTDRIGRTMATFMGLKDELFLEDLREKTRRGMLGQLRRGLSAGSRAYGYRSEPVYDPARKDPYGNPVVVGARKVIAPAEAAIVQRIFTMTAEGWSAKRIAHQLNSEGVPSPRSRVRGKGWTFSTIAGSQKKAIGILHNPLYVGKVVWNRSRKVRDPDTGRRITAPVPAAEWVWAEAPELRIIPDELWHQVQAKYRARGATSARFQYLLSGFMVCGVCGSHYVAKTAGYYGCASNINRGAAICPNGRLIRRDVIEPKILEAVRKELYDDETLAELTRRVNTRLRSATKEREAQRPAQIRQLHQAEAELEHIKAAIRAGVVTPSTRQMLEDAEATVMQLQAAMAAPARESWTAMPETLRKLLDDLPGLVAADPGKARERLRRIIGPIILRPTANGLEAEVRPAEFSGAGSGSFYEDGARSAILSLSKVVRLLLPRQVKHRGVTHV